MIDNFQTRFRFTNPDGTLTPEASRMLLTQFKQLGGYNGVTNADLEMLSVFTPSPDAETQKSVSTLENNPAPNYASAVAELGKRITNLQHEIAGIQESARLVGAMKAIAQLEMLVASIPNLTPAFTELSKNALTKESAITIKDTKFSIVDDGDTTKIAKFQASGITTGTTRTYNLPDVDARLATVLDKLSAFANTTSAELDMIITDGTGTGALVFATSPALVTPDIGAASGASLGLSGAATVGTGFGCNGKAAQTAFALGAAATDLPTVIALANNLRTMARNNGTGS